LDVWSEFRSVFPGSVVERLFLGRDDVTIPNFSFV